MPPDLPQLRQQMQQHELDIAQMQQNLAQYQQNVQKLLAEINAAQQSGNVDTGAMFHLQFEMEQMSQYIEAVSNTLQALHSEMMTMARATKGQ